MAKQSRVRKAKKAARPPFGTRAKKATAHKAKKARPPSGAKARKPTARRSSGAAEKALAVRPPFGVYPGPMPQPFPDPTRPPRPPFGAAAVKAEKGATRKPVRSGLRKI